MKKALSAVCAAFLLGFCAPIQAQQDPAAAPKSAPSFGTYTPSKQGVEDALKGPIPELEFAFKSKTGDSLIWFKGGSADTLFRGAWWLHKGSLFQLDAIIGGTLINGRYDDLAIEFWEPRVTTGRGSFKGTDDAVQLDCGAGKQLAYKTLFESDMQRFLTRLQKGKFKVVPLPEPGSQRLHTPCEPFLGRH